MLFIVVSGSLEILYSFFYKINLFLLNWCFLLIFVLLLCFRLIFVPILIAIAIKWVLKSCNRLVFLNIFVHKLRNGNLSSVHNEFNFFCLSVLRGLVLTNTPGTSKVLG